MLAVWILSHDSLNTTTLLMLLPLLEHRITGLVTGAEDLLWRAMALAIPCLARTPLQIAGPRFQAGVRPPWIGRRGPGDRFKAAENDSMKKRGSRIVGRGLSDCLSYFGFYSCSPCKLVGLLGGWGRKPACECAASRQVRREKRWAAQPSSVRRWRSSTHIRAPYISTFTPLISWLF